MPHGQSDLGHGAGRHRFDHVRAEADDRLLLSLGAHHEAGDVLHEKQRRTPAVAEFDELRCLPGALGIEDPSEVHLRPVAGRAGWQPLIGEDAHGNAVEPRVRADQLSRKPFLELIDAGAVHEPCENLVHVVALLVASRQQAPDLRWIERGRFGIGEGEVHPPGRWEPADHLADPADALRVVFREVVGHAADGRVHLRAAEGLRVHALPKGAVDQLGPPEAHER